MKFARRLLGWVSWTVLCTSCSATLDETLENRPCSAAGACVAGYVCSDELICVRAEDARMDPIQRADASTPSGRDPDAGAPDAIPVAGARASGRAGAGGGAGASAGSAAASGGGGSSGGAGASANAGASGTAGTSANAGASGTTGTSANAGASGTAGTPANAGASGTPPSPPPAAGTPSAPPAAGSMSEPDACTTGTRCDEQCVQLENDIAHCGACDRRCDAPEDGRASCVAGICAITCTAPRLLCDDACIDVSTNDDHCGSCDNECKDKDSCEQGVCKKAPPPPKGDTDVAALEVLLAVFGVSLEDFAKEIGVPVSKLDETEISLSDLGSVGISVAALALLGFSEDALELIGIEIDL